MYWDVDGVGLVGYGVGDGLVNLLCSVGGEFVFFGVVEFFYCVD